MRATTKLTRSAAIGAVLLMSFGGPAFAAISETRQLDSQGSPASTSRITRNAVQSTCAVPKAAALTLDVGPFSYETHSWINNGPTQCVTLTLTSTNCTNIGIENNNVHSSLYLGAFNPADPTANYLADDGISVGAAPFTTVTYSATVPAGAAVTVVVHSVANTAGPQRLCDYQLTSAELDLAPAAATVPTMTEWAMILFGLILAGGAALFVQRRQTITQG